MIKNPKVGQVAWYVADYGAHDASPFTITVLPSSNSHYTEGHGNDRQWAMKSLYVLFSTREAAIRARIRECQSEVTRAKARIRAAEKRALTWRAKIS